MSNCQDFLVQMMLYDDRGFPIFPQKINHYIKSENVENIEKILESGEVIPSEIFTTSIYLGKHEIAKLCLAQGFKLTDDFFTEEISNIEYAYDLPEKIDLEKLRTFLSENSASELLIDKFISSIIERKSALKVTEKPEKNPQTNFNFSESDILPNFSTSRKVLKSENIPIGRIRKILVETDKITRTPWVPNLKIYKNDPTKSSSLKTTFSNIESISSQLNLLHQNIKRTEIFHTISEAQNKEYENALFKLEKSLKALYRSCDEVGAIREIADKVKDVN